MAVPSTNPEMPAPGGPSPPVGAAPVPPTPSPPSRRLSTGAKAGIVIVVVAVIVVAALLLGLVPGVKLFGSSSGPAVSASDSALADTQGLASAHDVGSLVLAVGISTTYSFPFGNVSGSSNASCPITDPLKSNVTVPAQTGSYSNGDATLWIFVYVNTTTVTESIIAVVGSTPYFLGSVSGSSCVSTSTIQAISSGYVSSTQAASAANQGAGAFLSAHGSANALFLLVQSTGTSSAEWIVVYTNCSYDPVTETGLGGTKGDMFMGMVNGTTGVAEETIYDPGAANCSEAFSSESVVQGPVGPAAAMELTAIGLPGLLALAASPPLLGTPP